MRLASLSSHGLPHSGSLAIAFGPGLNVVEGDAGAAAAMREAIHASFAESGPAIERRMSDQGSPAESWYVELDVELDDGSLIRCRRDSDNRGASLHVTALPADIDVTADFVAGRLSAVPWLSPSERTDLAHLGALLHDDAIEEIVRPPAHPGMHQWWHFLNGWQLILAGAVSIAVGAFVWPQSRALAIVIGVIVAIAIAIVLVRLATQQQQLDRRRMLLGFGVRTTEELLIRVDKLHALEKRLHAEETARATLATYVNDHPSVAGWNSQPLGVSSPSGLAPVWISGRNDRGSPDHKDRSDEPIEDYETLRMLARHVQCFYPVTASHDDVVALLRTGDAMTTITLMD